MKYILIEVEHDDEARVFWEQLCDMDMPEGSAVIRESVDDVRRWLEPLPEESLP